MHTLILKIFFTSLVVFFACFVGMLAAENKRSETYEILKQLRWKRIGVVFMVGLWLSLTLLFTSIIGLIWTI